MVFDLERFKAAQASCYPEVLQEVRAGSKESHWMWFIFPQLAGLGSSPMATRYAISCTAEAEAYLRDEVLGTRLVELTTILVNAVEEKSAEEIFGYPDFLKFHSCMTLFHRVVVSNSQLASHPGFSVFERALARYFDGREDVLTTGMLGKGLSEGR